MNLYTATQIAQRLAEQLRPFCYRIEIAGSVRRQKPDVKDIELLALPISEEHVIDLFGGTEMVYPLRDYLSGNVPGDVLKFGMRYAQFLLPEGINLDLFMVLPPAQWGYLLTLRTGPAEFSKWVVTKRRQGGALPSDCDARDGGVYRGDELIEMPEEVDFFNLLGIEMQPPALREVLW